MSKSLIRINFDDLKLGENLVTCLGCLKYHVSFFYENKQMSKIQNLLSLLCQTLTFSSNVIGDK